MVRSTTSGTIRLDQRRERRRRQRAEGLRRQRHPRQAGHVDDDGALGLPFRLDADQRLRRLRVGVEDVDLGREERVDRAFGEVAALEAARVRARLRLVFLQVGQAVAVGIAARAVGAGRRVRVEAESDLVGVGQAVAVGIDVTELADGHGAAGHGQLRRCAPGRCSGRPNSRPIPCPCRRRSRSGSPTSRCSTPSTRTSTPRR